MEESILVHMSSWNIPLVSFTVLNNRSRKAMFFSIKLPLFSYISIQTYILMLIETVLLSTHNICLNQQIRKFSFMHSYLEVCYP